MKNTYKVIEEFLSRHGEWIRREMPMCGYGISLEGDPCAVALRPQKITPEVAEKIEQLRKKADAEGISLHVRKTGVIMAL